MGFRNWLAPILGTAGAVVGGILGGPAGATLGGSLGSMAGGAASGSGSSKKKSCKSGTCGHKGHEGQAADDLGIRQVSQLTPQQQNLQNESIKQALGLLQGSNAPGFGPIAENARKQFNTLTIPSLAERFSSLGANPQDTSFRGALGQAGADLEGQLGLLQGNYNQNLLQMLLGQGLRPSIENVLPQQEESRSPLGAQLLGQGSADLLSLLGQQYQEYQAKKKEATGSSAMQPKPGANSLLDFSSLYRNQVSQLPGVGRRLGGGGIS